MPEGRGYFVCYWCDTEVQICPKCHSSDDRQPTCSHCARSGALCKTHGTTWLGNVDCSEAGRQLVGNWVAGQLEEYEPVSAGSLPFRQQDQLDFLAFYCDLYAATPGVGLSNEGFHRER